MFAQLKRESLRKLRAFEDKSPKGSIDEPIVDLIRAINDHPNYVTSSSCSGRIAVFCGEPAVGSAKRSSGDDDGGAPSSTLITKGGTWLLAEHATVTFEQLEAALKSAETGDHSSSNMLIFKHEPFIMHVVCRDLDAAKKLLQWGISCGFRESGVVLGNKKIMCAIRTTSNSLEIPLGRHPNDLFVSDDYLKWILENANDKFRANKRKTDQLFAAFSSTFSLGSAQLSEAPSSQATLNNWAQLETDLKLVGHSSVRFEDSVVVFGGQGPTATGTTTRVASLSVLTADESGELKLGYNSSDSANGSTPSARMYHSAVMFGKRMVVFGGRAGPTRPLNDLYAFDMESKIWEQLQVDGDVSPSPRWKHSACLVGSTMYVFGGRDQDQVLSDLFALDLAQTPLSWRRIETSGYNPQPCCDHVCVVIDKTKLLVLGGVASLHGLETENASTSSHDSQHVECIIFDTKSEAWELIETSGPSFVAPPRPLVGASACALNERLVVVVGGVTDAGNGGSSSQKLYALSMDSLEWTALGNVTSNDAAFVGHTCEWIPSTSSLYVLGGGFQCFGFGQVYSSVFRCQLSISAVPRTAPSAGRPVKAIATGDSTTKYSATASSDEQQGERQGVIVDKLQVKKIKSLLENAKVYDKTRRVHVVTDAAVDGKPTAFLIPVLPQITDLLATTTDPDLRALVLSEDKDAYANKYGKSSGLNRNEVITSIVKAFAQQYGLSKTVQEAIPDRYEFVNDVLLVPRESFIEPEWSLFATEMWSQVCSSTAPPFSRVARKAFIDSGEKRQSHVELLYINQQALVTSRSREQPGWVEVRENGIIYGWDLTRVMFSSGNVTEKARMGKIGCQGEVIVDLFCGIGYYVLPFLVHGNAAFVHACEWNPDSVAALRFNLERNHVAHKCQVYFGDNQKSAPTIGAVADRVNLGLLPTSEKAWPLAVQVLKPTGGWLHVHDNVAVEDREAWEERVVRSIEALALDIDKRWVVSCKHVEKVKSYAPKVWHLVADVYCEMVPPSVTG